MFNYENAQAKGLWSHRTGLKSFQVLLLLIFLSAATIHFCLVWIGYSGLKMITPLVPIGRITLFFIFETILFSGMVYCIIKLQTSGRKQYEYWIKRHSEVVTESPIVILFRYMRYSLLPRPLDFVIKGSLFVVAFVFTIVVLNVPIKTVHVIPIIGVFLCFELFAKQTTYVWNDIRDIESDSQHPHKKLRHLAKYKAETFGKGLFIFRTILTLFITICLYFTYRIWWLLFLVVFTYIGQYIYDYWAKKKQIRQLILTALRYGERAALGVLVVMWTAAHYDFTLLFLVVSWTIVFAFVFLSAYWRANSQFLQKFKIVKTDDWFIRYNRKIQIVANLTLFPIGIVIAIIYSNSFVQQNLINGVIGLILGMGLVILFSKIDNIQKIRLYLSSSIIAGFIIIWVLIPVHFEVLLITLIAPVFIGALFMDITYEEIKMINVKGNIIKCIKTINRLLFSPTMNVE
ncbi:MAG: hypothetical protein PHE50_08265 [Dehalococcoidales bacterium]|nr:hypothetical protein [Dehalococcoidales bacterium]